MSRRAYDIDFCVGCDHSAPDHRFDGETYHECFVGGCQCAAYKTELGITDWPEYWESS